MNSPIGTKDRPWSARVSLFSGETTNTIGVGRPVALATEDVSKVVLPATATAATAHSMFAGVAAKQAAPGEVVEVISAGYVANAVIVTQTRAASTDAFASVASRPYGAVYTIDTARNAFAYSADSSTSRHYAVLAGSLPSIASVASNASITELFRTSTAKMWIRAML